MAWAIRSPICLRLAAEYGAALQPLEMLRGDGAGADKVYASPALTAVVQSLGAVGVISRGRWCKVQRLYNLATALNAASAASNSRTTRHTLTASQPQPSEPPSALACSWLYHSRYAVRSSGDKLLHEPRFLASRCGRLPVRHRISICRIGSPSAQG